MSFIVVHQIDSETVSTSEDLTEKAHECPLLKI